MTRPFVKMHGIGNDYIYFDCLTLPPFDGGAAAKRLTDRRRSIGGDGVVLILPSEAADAKMRMFNADGSEGRMCGNAIRCVGKYLAERRGFSKKILTIETLAGIRTLYLAEDAQGFVTVDMGSPVFDSEKIPANFEKSPIVGAPLLVGGREYKVTCLSMGNPHCVVFGDPDKVPLERLGPLFEHHPAFPARVNTEFVQKAGESLEMRVWERGSGETLACGTGACAAVVAATLAGLVPRGRQICVHLAGGDLFVRYADTVLLAGPAEFAFDGIASF